MFCAAKDLSFRQKFNIYLLESQMLLVYLAQVETWMTESLRSIVFMPTTFHSLIFTFLLASLLIYFISTCLSPCCFFPPSNHQPPHPFCWQLHAKVSWYYPLVQVEWSLTRLFSRFRQAAKISEIIEEVPYFIVCPRIGYSLVYLKLFTTFQSSGLASN